MSNTKIKFILTFCIPLFYLLCFSLNVYATNQISSSNLRLWLDAGMGTNCNLNGCSIDSWADQSGNASSAIRPSGSDDTIYFKTNRYNFNPTINFDILYEQSKKGLQGNFNSTINSPGIASIFFVGKMYDNGSSWPRILSLAPDIYKADRAYNTHFTIDRPYGTNSIITMQNNIQRASLDNTYGTTDMIGEFLYGTGAQSSAYLNGSLQSTTTHTLDTLDIYNYFIGANSEYTHFTKMDLAEIMIYDTELSSVDRLKIESYLAIKYGMTLSGGTIDYLNSSGNTIWGSSINSGYTDNIAGIGRDDNTSLNQKQSSSINMENILTIGLGTVAPSNTENINTFSDDNSYLIWGDNGGTISFSTTSNGDKKMERTWKFQKTSNFGSPNIRIMIPNSILWPGEFEKKQVILVGASSSFAFDVKAYNFSNTITINDITYRYADIPAPEDAYYLSFAEITNPSFINIISPNNGSYFNTGSIIFSGTGYYTGMNSLVSDAFGNTLCTYTSPLIFSNWTCNTINLLEGNYTATVYQSDYIGNTINFTIDLTAPIINLNGSGSIDVVKGYSYTDLGATCSDNYDSSCNVVNSGSVDTNTLGLYTITYNATDTAGNKADEITRAINVISGNTPVITLIGTGTVNHEVKTIYTDSGAIANDTEDGDLTASIIASGSVDTNTLGSYIITYNVSDISGNNAGELFRTINVIDTTKPIITLNGNSTQDIILGNSYLELGATCSDDYDSSCNVVNSGNVDTNTLGSYIITYNATDNSGNNANEITRTINVIKDNSSQSSGGGGSGGGTPKIDYTKGLELKISSFTENENNGETSNDSDDNNLTDNSEENFDENSIVSSFESCFVINALNDENFSFSGGIFSDINESQYKDLINKFISLQIINGNTNGLFEPTREITRAEFIKIVLLSHCYDYKDEDVSGLIFKDVKIDSWQAHVIIKAQNLGIVVGDINEKGDKVFRPNDTISKSEALKILIKTASIRLDTLQNPNNNFSDDDWYQKYIEIVKSLGIFENDEDTFLEEGGVNREDMIFMIYNIINLYK